MADSKVSSLTSLAGASIDASADLIPIIDVSAGSAGSKKTTINDLKTAMALIPTGTRLTGYWSSAPSGYVLANGTTIGNASSSGTGRANADTADLFALLWTNLDDSLAPVSGGRGVSAVADFAANKRITLPDERLRVPVMAQSGANLYDWEGILGSSGGAESHTLSEAELPVVAGHSHNVPTSLIGLSDSQSAGPSEGGGDTVATDIAGGFGSGAAHNNVQPFICVNVAIKL